MDQSHGVSPGLGMEGVDLQGSSHNGALHDPGRVLLLLIFSFLTYEMHLSCLKTHCRLRDHSLLELCVKKKLNRF